MLESLVDADFAELEDAYGPAVDVPARLRAIAAGENVEDEINDLGAGIFHQGSYYSATAPATRFLVEIAIEPAPAHARREVISFLADMAGGEPAPQIDWDPYVFRSTPAAPEYPEAEATIAVIRESRARWEDVLSDPDPEVRAQVARLLAAIRDPASLAKLEAAAKGEKDEEVRAGFALARVALGGAIEDEPPASDPLVAQVIASARASRGQDVDEPALAAIEAAALAPRRPAARFPWRNGDVMVLAVEALSALGAKRPDDATRILRRAIEARLARGERPFVHEGAPMPRVCDVGPPAARPDLRDWSSEPAVALRTLAGALAPAAFARFREFTRPVRREELSQDEREMLAWTCDYGLLLGARAVPWLTRESMRRFLDGGGPLDRPLEALGVTAPVYEHFHSIASVQAPPERRAAIFAALDRLSPLDLFDLCADVLTRAYPALDIAEGYALRHADRRALRQRIDFAAVPSPRLDAYRRELIASRWATAEQAMLALGAELERAKGLDPSLDRLLSLAIAADHDGAPGWLARVPEPRRSRLLASLGNLHLLGKLGSHCDPSALAREIVEAFLQPDCRWYRHDAELLLRRADDLDLLRAARERAAGDDRRIAVIDAAIREVSGAAEHLLELRKTTSGIEATLRNPEGATLATATLTAAPLPAELEPLVAPLTGLVNVIVRLKGDTGHTIEYRISRLLADLGIPKIRAGSSQLSTTRSD